MPTSPRLVHHLGLVHRPRLFHEASDLACKCHTHTLLIKCHRQTCELHMRGNPSCKQRRTLQLANQHHQLPLSSNLAISGMHVRTPAAPKRAMPLKASDARHNVTHNHSQHPAGLLNPHHNPHMGGHNAPTIPTCFPCHIGTEWTHTWPATMLPHICILPL